MASLGAGESKPLGREASTIASLRQDCTFSHITVYVFEPTCKILDAIRARALWEMTECRATAQSHSFTELAFNLPADFF